MIMKQEITAEQLKNLRNVLASPIGFTSKTGTIKGKPFSFKGRNHLIDVYEDMHPRLVIVAGRQVEKSETVARKLLHSGYTRPYTTITYTAPRNEQVSRFQQERFRSAIKDSQQGILEASVDKSRDAKTATRLTNRTMFYFGSAWADGDSLRGISGDMVFFDEVQDIPQTAIETIEKSVSHSEIVDEKLEINGKIVYTGTPKESGSYYDRILWGKSDQKKWAVTCSCGHVQFMTMKNIMLQNEGTKKERRYFGCLQCEKELNRENGEWIKTKPENKMYSGYLFSQLNMYWISANQIWFDYQNMDAETFHNEVLGEFYSGLAKPVTLEMVLACTDSTKRMAKRSDEPTALGVDYGSGGLSKTIITIGKRIKGTKDIEVLYVENCNITDHEKLVEHIGKLVNRFNVEKIAGDIGYGGYEAEKLYKLYGKMACAVRYVSYTSNPKKREVKEGNVVHVDRTHSMDRTINMFQKKQFVLPYKKEEDGTLPIEFVFDHYTALQTVFTESKTNSGRKLYDHATPDDGFHSLNLLREAIWELENRFEWEGAYRETDYTKILDIDDDLPDW